MQNLLTTEYKKNVSRLYHGRLFTMTLFMFCLVAIISLILLSTLSFLLYITSSESIKQITVSDKNADKNTVRQDYNSFFKNLAFLPVDIPSLNFAEIFDLILVKKPAGIFLREVVFSQATDKENAGTITVRGTASTRPLLVSFTEVLRSESVFLSVDSPVANLLKEQNLDFLLTIVLKQTTTPNAKKS